MSTLTPCPACSRHVREQTCPFCGAEVPAPAARPRFVGPVTRAAVFSAVTGAAIAGCWTGRVAEPANATTETTETTPTETTNGTSTTETTATHGQADALPFTGAVEGIVTDTQTGQPVVGAQVRLDNKQITTSDYSGHYRFPNVPAGRHTVTVYTQGNRNHGGGATATATIDVRSSLARVDVQVDVPAPTFDPNSIPKPYGAPPARRRLV